MGTTFLKKHRYQLSLALFVMLLVITGFDTAYKMQFKDSRLENSGDTSGWPKTFGIGRTATQAEISVLDISIRPDGRGLPPGTGNVATGKRIYDVKCFTCHGKTGTEGPFSALVAVPGDSTKTKTIGNYWPYATTLFDYIRRAMPFNQPGSLNNNEVYSLTAYLLYKNKIIDPATEINAASLPTVKMPAQQLFVNDDRHGGPEVK